MYEDQVEKRTYNICGKSYEFTAVKSDHGTWDGGGGPIGDWPDHLAIWTKHIRNYEVVVQAGGAQGLYPRLLSEMFQRVYTFEPDGLEFHCLVQNCQSDNIFKLNAALGETTGLVTLHRNSPDNMGMNTMSIESDSKIPMLTIDSLCLDSCDFMQLDVEGFETPIILGAMTTINRFKPVIACENANDVIRTLLEPMGYKEVGRSHADTIYAVV